MIIVDTSILVDFLKGKDTPQTRYFYRLEQQNVPFAIPVICAQELLQGARDAKEYKTLRSYLITQELLASKDPVATHFEAAKIYFDCKRKGVTPRSTIDCLIVRLVIEHGGVLLHFDRDFENIGRVVKFNRVLDF